MYAPSRSLSPTSFPFTVVPSDRENVLEGMNFAFDENVKRKRENVEIRNVCKNFFMV